MIAIRNKAFCLRPYFILLICSVLTTINLAQEKPVFRESKKGQTGLQLSDFAFPDGTIDRLKLSYIVEQLQENGFPARFSCIQEDGLQRNQWSSIWAQRLPVLLGMSSDKRIQFKEITQDVDLMGNVHIKYEQLFGAYPILNSQYFLHIYPNNQVMGHGHTGIPAENLSPVIHENQLHGFVSRHITENELGKFPAPEFNKSISIKEKALIYWQRKQDQKWFLVYKTSLLLNDIEPWILLINSENGDLLKAQAQHCGFHIHDTQGSDVLDLKTCLDNNSHDCRTQKYFTNENHAMGAETTTALDLNDINQTINVWREGQDVYCIDGSRPMFQLGNFTLNNPLGAIWTLDALNSNNPGLNQIKTKTNTWAAVAVSAHHNAGKVYEYFLNTFNRNSIDGVGGTIRSFVNFGMNYSGAFWSSGTIYYGNGNVSKGYFSFAKGIDISAHEMSHGLIDASAGLEYDAESGAINESMADIFACMVDRDNWTLGEEVIVPGHPIHPSGAVRNMANPGQGLPKDSFRLGWQPNHVNQQYKGLSDGGGVHWNSGIPNHAFYLFVQALIPQAGSEENAKKMGEQIYYHALLYYLTRQADFKELRAAIERACLDLYPANANIAQLASNAFEMVGITSGAEPGGGIFDIGENNLPVNPGIENVICTRSNINANRNEGVYIRNMATQEFKQLSNLNIICKPAVTDDGKRIYFVATDFKVYKLEYNPTLASYEQSLFIDNPVHRYVNVSKDGRFLALLEMPVQNNNQIKVIDLISLATKNFTLTNPVTQTGINNSTVMQIGSVDFDHSGRYILYDALSTYFIVNGNSFQQWDLGVLRFWDAMTDQFGDGAIEKVFRAPLADISQDVIYHFRNPVFSKNSPAVIAFDFYLGNFNNQTYQNSNAIVGAHLEKGELKYLQQGLGGLAYPNFSMEDDSMSFDHAYLINNRPPSRIQTFGLQANKLDSAGTGRLFINGYRWANRFGNGVRKLINSIPIATQDMFSTDEDVNLNADVAANDATGKDLPFTWKPVGTNGGALHGTLNMNVDGKFTYIPNPNFNGTDEFAYELCDADQECSTAKAIINIRSINDIPVALDDAGSTKQNVNLTGNVAQNDVLSGDGGNYWRLDIPNGGASGGSVNLNPNGQYLYIPNTNFFGTDQFAYSLCDTDQDCSPAIVKIIVEQIVGLDHPSEDNAIFILNNLVQDKLIIIANGMIQEKLFCCLYDVLGRKLIENELHGSQNGQTRFEWDLTGLNKGWYGVSIQGKHLRYYGKIMKE